MLSVTPAAPYWATLQTDEYRWNAGEKTLTLQSLEHLINRVQHQYLYLATGNRQLSQILP
ncbi:Uncharacterized protein YR821_0661 [Yersinia ruckeri]|uniref:Uncharacterized protein n=1 Tax=Yersinia ruckeri TaxID=29486 RepID=A0A0A8VES1_YERRU|nr:hypothetical protein yruck0001_24390 [Yersinia ruckeri ATCC 29473]QTD75593.1 Uncharacterized protein YR821_0661 [Yersinia ruckeri]CEK26489.1 hypothetical protein CSF007_3550 [Yersinia ruckeri]